MSVHVTGGTVRFNQRLKTGDFEWKEATTELTFSGQEAEDVPLEAQEKIAERAVEQVAKMLKLAPKAAPVGRIPKPVAPNGLTPRQEAKAAGAAVAESATVADLPADVAAPVGGDVTEAKLPDVTDKDMNLAVAAKAEKGENKAAIRDLIFKFAKPISDKEPGNLRTIEQKFRREFLEALKALP